MLLSNKKYLTAFYLYAIMSPEIKKGIDFMEQLKEEIDPIRLTQNIDTIKTLTKKLQYYSEQYYVYDNPVISDKAYDDLYDELEKLEQQTGFVMNGSPTQKVQGQILEGFSKVKHSKPMLSAAKTKDIDEVKKWIGDHSYYASAKCDGGTIVLKYNHGKLVQAITRGDGYYGEDVTEQAKMIENVPLQIPYDDELELRGECLIEWEDFNKVNETLDVPYSHPRNLATGTLRQLNTNMARARHLKVYIFEVVTDLGIDDKIGNLLALSALGFTVVPMAFDPETGVEGCIEAFKASKLPIPIDGIIFELRSCKESAETGRTEHHENCRIAYKFENTTYETTLRDIEWQVSRKGVLSPVAVFDAVDLDGALTTKATLHNASIVESFKFGIGDTITVYRSNEVIPAVDENITQSGTYVLPNKCPCCNSDLKIEISESGTKILRCENPECSAKIIQKVTHFCSKHAMNVEGLSDKNIATLVSLGYIKDELSLYQLGDFNALTNLPGFGAKSVNNLISALEKSKRSQLHNLIYALGIDNIGRKAATTLAEHFNQFSKFVNACQTNFDFTTLSDFGVEAQQSLYQWGSTTHDFCKKLIEIFGDVEEKESKSSLNNQNSNISGKIFVITGHMNNYTRDSICEDIQKYGGKIGSGITAKTDYLINNDTTSTSSKNKKAQELNIPIISEADYEKLKNN